MPRRRPPKSKHYCFTINHPTLYKCIDGSTEKTPATKQQFFDANWDDDLMSYMIIGSEKADTTGTPHFQGYVAFTTRLRLTQVSKLNGFKHAYLTIKHGSSKQAITYCSKDGDYLEHGERPTSASTRMTTKNHLDWEGGWKFALANQIEKIQPMMRVKYYHNWKRILQDNPIKPTTLQNRDNYWIVAPTGYGKSHYARELFPGRTLYDKSPNKWFVGYKGEDILLLDDFGPKECEHLGWYMKRWADKYAFPMENKGGGLSIRPQNIITTSQYTIEECFEDPKVAAAMNGRFQTIYLTPWQERVAAEEAAQTLADMTATTEEIPIELQTQPDDEITNDFEEPISNTILNSDEEISCNDIPQHPDLWESILPRSKRISPQLNTNL